MVDPLLLKALKQTRLDIQQAQAEIETLRQAISSFETLVSQRLGGMLDQLSALDAEVESLTAEVRQKRTVAIMLSNKRAAANNFLWTVMPHPKV